ncbi:MAG: SDR family oxidoreductase [Saprospiraceae bacterium]|nr:SDR family oxidoreductase [Saprospiraceae bacterium]
MNTIITGGTKGIGLAIAHAYAREGSNLSICSRNSEDLTDFKAQFEKQYPGLEILVFKADLSVKKEVQAYAAHIRNHWSHVDVLVNNAGRFIPGKIQDEEDGVLEDQINTNLYSAYHLTRLMLPLMLPQSGGHIFNICSIASFMAYPNGGSYSISKFAMLGFSKVLREELKEKGIKVSSIMPGATWSASWHGADLPQSRLMKAEDIALAVVSAWKMSPSAVVEEIIIRPQLGDL